MSQPESIRLKQTANVKEDYKKAAFNNREAPTRWQQAEVVPGNESTVISYSELGIIWRCHRQDKYLLTHAHIHAHSAYLPTYLSTDGSTHPVITHLYLPTCLPTYVRADCLPNS